MPTRNQIEAAALCMEHLCIHDWHGYTQGGGRWGDGEGTCPVDTPIGTCYVEQGDRDCSSAVISSYEAAGIDCGGATYTGNMVDCMTSTGNFRIHWMNGDGYNCDDGYVAKRGDCYINEGAHTAMCTSQIPDKLAEFCIAETGGIYGQTGDQTGWESVTNRNFYAYPWNVCLEVIVEDDPEPAPAPEPEPEPAPAPAPSGKTRLCGIDIASWQAGITPSYTQADFVIIKVSGGTSYENPYWRQWADDVLASGKKLGLYHYACEYDSEPGGWAEADYFWARAKDYAGKFIPILDWEAHAIDMPVGYAREFLERIAELSGATPWFYGYASNVNSVDYSSISQFPLWMASYLDRYIGAGFETDPEQRWGSGTWPYITAYQYTSQGRISGYSGDLDLSVFYGSEADWDAMAGGGSPAPAPTPGGDAPESISYAVKTAQDGWLPFVTDLSDYAGIPGHAAVYLAVDMHGHGWYQVKSQRNGWLPPVRDCNINDYEYGCAGDGSPILAVRVYYETQDPNATGWWKAKYRTANLGAGYYDWQFDDETGGGQDGYAGDGYNAIDRVQITLAR